MIRHCFPKMVLMQKTSHMSICCRSGQDKVYCTMNESLWNRLRNGVWLVNCYYSRKNIQTFCSLLSLEKRIYVLSIRSTSHLTSWFKWKIITRSMKDNSLVLKLLKPSSVTHQVTSLSVWNKRFFTLILKADLTSKNLMGKVS